MVCCRRVQAIALSAIASLAANVSVIGAPYEIDSLSRAYETGTVSVIDVTEEMLLRIAERDGELRAYIAVNPNARAMARARDAFHADGVFRGPLDGIPIAVKDNIETLDPLPTTAGSLALEGNVTRRDADVVARLRAVGAVIMGKANLSEWANFRSRFSSSGWSAMGGQTRNPYDLTRTPCGSSSGSAVAVASGMAVAAIGTETDGSIVCPAAVNGLVGFKPAIGELSTAGIVPIAPSQDTAGPITHTVIDALLLTEAMGGATSAPLAHRLRSVDAQSLLRGKRIGILRGQAGYHPRVDATFDATIAALAGAGAVTVDGLAFDMPKGFRKASFDVLVYEFKNSLNAYLATLPAPYGALDLGQIIEFNRVNADRELVHFGQDLLELANTKGPLTSGKYLAARALVERATRSSGIDGMMAEHRLDALIAPTTTAAWSIDHVNGDHYLGGSAGPAAIAGYPHLTVPMGVVADLPVGLSIYGPPRARTAIFEIGRAVELLRSWRQSPTLATGHTRGG